MNDDKKIILHSVTNEEHNSFVGLRIRNEEIHFYYPESYHLADKSNRKAFRRDVINIIRLYRKRYGKQLMLVCEDYLLYASKLEDQINSRMETCKLIGAIQLYCHQHGICYYMQTAAEVKKRWENKILLYKGYIKPYRRSYVPTSGITDTYTHHTLDAIRHAVHYAIFKNGR